MNSITQTVSNEDHKRLSNQLELGLKELGLSLSCHQQQQLILLVQLLSKWNRHFNLTAISEAEKMVSHHILDSLSVVPYIFGSKILDFGSGAGFPGLPLACYFPQKHFVLVESVGKKARFIMQAVAELQIKNVEVIANRIEKVSPALYQFDCIVSRAVCTLEKFITLTQTLSHDQTRWLAMKGELTAQELDEMTLPHECIQLNVPGISSKRQVVIAGSVFTKIM